MQESHQLRLYGSSTSIFSVVEARRLLREIMLPFEVLNRFRWSAPWEGTRR